MPVTSHLGTHRSTYEKVRKTCCPQRRMCTWSALASCQDVRFACRPTNGHPSKVWISFLSMQGFCRSQISEREIVCFLCLHNIFGPKWQKEPHLGGRFTRQISDDTGAKFQRQPLVPRSSHSIPLPWVSPNVQLTCPGPASEADGS